MGGPCSHHVGRRFTSETGLEHRNRDGRGRLLAAARVCTGIGGEACTKAYEHGIRADDGAGCREGGQSSCEFVPCLGGSIHKAIRLRRPEEREQWKAADVWCLS